MIFLENHKELELNISFATIEFEPFNIIVELFLKMLNRNENPSSCLPQLLEKSKYLYNSRILGMKKPTKLSRPILSKYLQHSWQVVSKTSSLLFPVMGKPTPETFYLIHLHFAATWVLNLSRIILHVALYQYK